MYDNHHPEDWDREPGGQERPGKKGGILKKIVILIASGLLFGTAAGVVMFGMNIWSSDFIQQLSVSADILPGTPSNGRMAEQGEAPLERSEAQPRYEKTAPVADVSGIVEQAMPTVVAITSTAVYQSNNYGYGWFFGGGGSQTYEVPSSGSGIIIGENDTELLIVTNNHVVQDSTSLKVSFIDDKVVDAAIKGTDADTDLAVIAVPLDTIEADTRSKISAATLGNSDELKVGQGVVAIGNALGYGQSVTVGYVSALNREVKVSEGVTRTLLQTDAAINPGNSGGALLNMKGELIGINAAKYASTEVEGIGYAIPISKAQDILGQLMNRKTRAAVEEAKRGYLGIQGTSVDDDAAKTFGMPKGVYVYKILSNGAASGSDLREKDIITKVDGQSLTEMTQLQELLTSYEAGEQVELTVQTQQDGQYVEHTVTVTLAAMPKGDAGAETAEGGK